MLKLRSSDSSPWKLSPPVAPDGMTCPKESSVHVGEAANCTTGIGSDCECFGEVISSRQTGAYEYRRLGREGQQHA